MSDILFLYPVHGLDLSAIFYISTWFFFFPNSLSIKGQGGDGGGSRGTGKVTVFMGRYLFVSQ